MRGCVKKLDKAGDCLKNCGQSVGIHHEWRYGRGGVKAGGLWGRGGSESQKMCGVMLQTKFVF